jgi:hypothetical protein
MYRQERLHNYETTIVVPYPSCRDSQAQYTTHFNSNQPTYYTPKIGVIAADKLKEAEIYLQGTYIDKAHLEDAK